MPARGSRPYSPHDYDNKFEGAITLRRALEQSRNVPAVRTMEQMGPKKVVDYARRFGFQQPMEPYLSLALGAGDASLLEIVAAYSVFPNQGVLMRPFQVLRIVDRDGNLLEENRPQSKDVVRADTAYVMTSLLRGRGAARHGGDRGVARLAAGGQDGHDQRLHRRVVHRLRPEHHGGRLDRPRRQEAARAVGDRRARRRCRSGSRS